jgi:hypothetical protein
MVNAGASVVNVGKIQISGLISVITTADHAALIKVFLQAVLSGNVTLYQPLVQTVIEHCST